MKEKLLVFIDAGHGPNNSAPGKLDPGAVSTSSGIQITEYGIALEVATGVQELVKNDTDKDFEVVLVPELSRSGVAAYVNLHSKNRPNSIMLSLHMNASKFAASSGTEVILAAPAKKALMKSAIEIGLAFSAATNRTFRGVKVDTQIPASYVTVLRLATIPAFLIEMGFIGNNSDVAAVRDNGSAAIVAAIEAYQRFLEKERGKD